MLAPTPSISATGPLEERQIAYVCREALKVARPIRLLTAPTPRSRGQGAQLASVGVECLRPGWPEGLWVLGEGAPALLPEAAHFPLGSVTSCLGRGEEEAAWVGGPVLREGSGKVGCCWVAALRGSSLSPGAAPLAFSREDPQGYQGRGVWPWASGEGGGGGGSPELQMGFSRLHSYRAPTFSSPSREMSSWVSTRGTQSG